MINFRMRLTQPSERNRTVWEIADALRKDLDGIAEIEKYSVSTQDGMSFGGGNAISVEIYGYDFAKNRCSGSSNCR
jgi:HAE1 family hydrophobic/amphiphilic exporter-1